MKNKTVFDEEDEQAAGAGIISGILILAVVGILGVVTVMCSGCLPAPTPAPRPIATATQATASPSPSPAFKVRAPLIDMTASGEATSAIIEVTQHYIVRPDVLNPQVRDEVPTLDSGSEFWRNRSEGKQRARNCDPDHYFFNDGSKAPMWWICGGSEKWGVEPRDWDVLREEQPATVTCTPATLLKAYPRPRDVSGYYRVVVGPGPGSCTVCLPGDGSYTTPDGIGVPVAGACGTWPVQ